MSKSGPERLHALDPFVRTEAECFCWEEGIETETCSEGGINIANIENGDYVKVKGVDFSEGADTFTASVSSAEKGGSIELRIDSPPAISSAPVRCLHRRLAEVAGGKLSR